MVETKFTDPQSLADKINWEGWPAALEWFQKDVFEDKELYELVYEAIQNYTLLENTYDRITKRLEELGVEVN